MTATIPLSAVDIEATRARADAQYSVYYEGVAAMPLEGKTEVHTTPFKQNGSTFGAALTAVNKAIDRRESFARALGTLQPAYATYVAAAALSSGARPKTAAPFAQTLEHAIENNTLFRTTLEGLLGTYVRSGVSARTTNAYFGAVAHTVGQRVCAALPETTRAELAKLQWMIHEQRISGLPQLQPERHQEPPLPGKEYDRSSPSAAANELQHIHFAPGRVLRREQIIGDAHVLDDLERQARNLSFYDMHARANPLKQAGIFTNRYVLQGPPGTGKTEVIFYIAQYAREQAKKLGLPTEIVRLNADSAWQDGGILSAQAQFKQICQGDKLYIIVQDELGSLFSKRAVPDIASTKIEKEFLRFANGEYPDRGNYLLLGTVNDLTDIPEAVARAGRMNVIHWPGPTRPEDLATLLRTKLLHSVHPDVVTVTPAEYLALGGLAQQHCLSGADITAIADVTKARSLDWDKIDANARRGPYDARVAAIRSAYTPITFHNLTESLYEHVESRSRSIASSMEQRT